MKEILYNLMRVPHYKALIEKHGEVIGRAIVPMKGNIRSFTVKSLKMTFLLPNGKTTDIPPLKIKSGRLLVYDVNSVIPMKLGYKTEEGLDWMEEDMRVRYVSNPKQYYLPPVNPEELYTSLESKFIADIMSSDERDIPTWLLYLIGCAVAGAIIIGVVYLVTHGTPVTITEYIPMPTANPTSIPTLIPATMKPGI